MIESRSERLRVGMIGAGAVAACVVEQAAGLEDIRVVGFTARGGEGTDRFAGRFGLEHLDLEQLIGACDVLVEAAHPLVLQRVAPAALSRGKTLVVMSVNGLIACPSLVRDARRSGGRLLLVSGALAGLDAISAARVGGIDTVRLKTSKPPAAFPNHFKNLILSEPLRIFAGTAREAAATFPKNTNVAASLAVAAFDVETGPDRVTVEIWADPSLTENVHAIEVVSAAGTIRASVLNRPLSNNAATSRLAADSVIAALNKLVAPCAFA